MECKFASCTGILKVSFFYIRQITLSQTRYGILIDVTNETPLIQFMLECESKKSHISEIIRIHYFTNTFLALFIIEHR